MSGCDPTLWDLIGDLGTRDMGPTFGTWDLTDMGPEGHGTSGTWDLRDMGLVGHGTLRTWESRDMGH